MQGYSHVALLSKKTRQQLLEFEQFLQTYNIIHIFYNGDNSQIRFLLDSGCIITMTLNSLTSELQSMHIDKSIQYVFKNGLAMGIFFEQTCIINEDICIYLYNFGNKNNKKTIACPLPFSIEQLSQMTLKEMKLNNSNNLLCIKYDNNILVIVSLTYVTFIKLL